MCIGRSAAAIVGGTYGSAADQRARQRHDQARTRCPTATPPARRPDRRSGTAARRPARAAAARAARSATTAVSSVSIQRGGVREAFGGSGGRARRRRHGAISAGWDGAMLAATAGRRAPGDRSPRGGPRRAKCPVERRRSARINKLAYHIALYEKASRILESLRVHRQRGRPALRPPVRSIVARGTGPVARAVPADRPGGLQRERPSADAGRAGASTWT